MAVELDARPLVGGMAREEGGRESYFGIAGNRRISADWLVFWAFVAALAWCPFYFGSNDPLAWGINAVLFPCLVVVFEACLLATSGHHPVSIGRLKMPALLFGLVVLWTFVQNAIWTPENWHHPIWHMAADALQRPLNGSISVNRDLTTLGQVRLITAASAFWLAVQLCRNARRADLLVKAIGVIVTAYAAYGLVSFVVAPGSVLWLSNRNPEFVSSTFINKNSFATYVGIGFIALCGVLLRLYHREALSQLGSPRLATAAMIEATGKGGALLLGGAFLTLVSLLLTGSRGGILSTGLGTFVLATLVFTRRSAKQGRLLEIVIFVAALFVAVVVAFGDVFFGRLADEGLRDENRMALNLLTLGSIRDSPLLGFGYGTFIDVFPMYRDGSISTYGVYEKAHNDYLEILQGLGLVFGSFLFASVGLLVLRCMRGAARRQLNATIPSVAAAAGFLVGVHSLVDFSLQIQAVTLTFAALLGAGVAQSTSSREPMSDVV
jgi:O-antigen ligase